MEIKTTIIGRHGKPLHVIYKDIENEKDFEGIKIESVRGYCFYNNKIVVVHESKGHWVYLEVALKKEKMFVLG